MKTAEELRNGWPMINCEPGNECFLECVQLEREQQIEYINQMLLEAYKAGMTRAAEICDKRKIVNNSNVPGFNEACWQVKSDIITTRDSLTELPL